MDFGERIVEIRKEKGISQKELAKRLSVSPVMVAHWEKGRRKPKADTLKKIADALEVPLSRLYALDPDAVYLGSEITFIEPDPDNPEEPLPFSADSRTMTGKVLNVLTGLREPAYQETWLQMGEDLIDLRNKLKEK